MTTDIITDQIDFSGIIAKLLEELEDGKRKNSPLARTMKDILDTIANSRGILQHIEDWFWDLVYSDRDRQLLVECAIEGILKAGLFTILEDGKFTLDQLVKKALTARKAEGPGVYIRVYLFKRRKSALYIGSSGHMMHRMKGHDSRLIEYITPHGRAYRRAIKKHYRVLCDLGGNAYAEQDKRVRLVIEQLLVILFGTYDTPNLPSSHDILENQTSTQLYRSAAPGQMVTISVYREPTDPIGKIVEKDPVSESIFVDSTKTSITLAKLGNEVCGKCGWQQVIIARPDSNGNFGPDIIPLNWLSPIDTTIRRPRKTTIAEDSTTAMTVYHKAAFEVIVATGDDTGIAA